MVDAARFGEDRPPPLVGVHITFFNDHAAQRYTTEHLTMPQLRELILQRSARKKGDLPWLKLAMFGNNRTGKGSLRHDHNVLQITGVELDYDGLSCRSTTMDEFAARLAPGLSTSTKFRVLNSTGIASYSCLLIAVIGHLTRFHAQNA